MESFDEFLHTPIYIYDMYILSKRESEDDDASILLVVAESSTIDYTLSSISRALDGRCIELLQQLLILKVKSVCLGRG